MAETRPQYKKKDKSQPGERTPVNIMKIFSEDTLGLTKAFQQVDVKEKDNWPAK